MRLRMGKKGNTGPKPKSKKKQQPPPPPKHREQPAMPPVPFLATPRRPQPPSTTAHALPTVSVTQDGKDISDTSPISGLPILVTTNPPQSTNETTPSWQTEPDPPLGMTPLRYVPPGAALPVYRGVPAILGEDDHPPSDDECDEVDLYDIEMMKRHQEEWKQQRDAQYMAQRATPRTASEGSSFKTASQCGSVGTVPGSNPSDSGSGVSSGTYSGTHPTTAGSENEHTLRIINNNLSADLYSLNCEISRLEDALIQSRQECREHHPTGGNVKQKIEVNEISYGCWDEVVDDLNTQLDCFVEQNLELTKEKAEGIKRISELHKERADLAEAMQSLVVKLKKAEGLANSQDQKVRDLKVNLEKSVGQKDLLEKVQGKLVTAESHKANLDHKLQASVAECNTLREQMKATQEKWEDTTAELAKITQALADLQQEVKCFENERTSLKDQLQKSKAAQALATTKLAQVGKKDPVVIKEIASLKLQIQKLERKCVNREKEVDILEEEIASTNAQQAEVNKELEARDEKTKIFEEELETLRLTRINQKHPAKSSVHDLEVKFLKGQLNELRTSQKQASKSHEQEIKVLKDQLTGSESKVAEEKTIADLKLLVADQTNKIKYLSDQLQQLSDQSVETTESSKGRNTANEFLEEQLRNAKASIQSLQQQLQQQLEANKTYSTSLLQQLDQQKQHIQQQSAHNTSMRTQLANLHSKYKTQDQEVYFLRDEIERANYHSSKLENQIAYLQNIHTHGSIGRQASHAKSKSDASRMILKSPHAELEQAHLILQQGHVNLYKEHQLCKTTIQDLRNRLAGSTRDHQNVLEDSTVAKKDQFKAAVHQTALVQDLQNKITQLEQGQEGKDLFIKCAIDVRLGFLEHARVVMLDKPNLTREEESFSVRINAKIATHCTNGQLDADILTHLSFPADLLASATQTFLDLYSIEPERYGEWGVKSKRLVDCQATLKSIPKDESLGLETEDLEEYYRTVQNLLVLRQEVGDESFEESEEAEWLVGRLEYLTGMIVAMRV